MTTARMLVLMTLLSGLLPADVRAQSATPEQSIRQARWLLQRNPRDARAYDRLGDAYIQKARETGDVSYLGLAETALATALSIAPDLGGAARRRAYVMYLRHGFAEAAAEAARIVAREPTDAHALGILGDAHLEQGHYEQAADAYGRMLALRSDLYALGRASALKGLRGDTRGAIEDLERAIAEGRANRRPPESVAWAQWQLGVEHFNAGALGDAETAFQEALTTCPGYHRAVAGLAQVRAAQRRYPEAIELYGKALAVIPLPDYAAALGDVYRKAGREDEARQQYELVEYIGRLNALNRVLYNRELAYFYADHDVRLGDALALAEREHEVRRDVYAFDLLAWARFKNGDARGAVAPMQKALELGTRDARLFFHAGLIHRALGDTEAARTSLRRALATNPHFHVLLADAAVRVLEELDGR